MRQPSPPDLLPPWHSDDRAALQQEARDFAREVVLHGGNGYTTERRVERYWRDARLTIIFEGIREIQRRTLSDRMLPRG